MSHGAQEEAAHAIRARTFSHNAVGSVQHCGGGQYVRILAAAYGEWLPR